MMFRLAVNPLFCYFSILYFPKMLIYIYIREKDEKERTKKKKNTKCVKAYYICYGPMTNLRFKNNESEVWFLKII